MRKTQAATEQLRQTPRNSFRHSFARSFSLRATVLATNGNNYGCPCMQQFRPSRRQRTGFRILAFLASVILADVLLSEAAWHIAAASIREADPAVACAPVSGSGAAIVVFYSDDPASGGERLEAAAELARFCPSALIFLVGGARPHRGFFGSEEMARRLEMAGIERPRMRAGRASYDTESNILEARAMAMENGALRLVLVSDALHLVRIHADFGETPPGMQLFDRPVGREAGLLRKVTRANYEAAAWLGMAAPEALRGLVFKITGRRGGAG
jgi:uncharacterized SAM-binding protein YcdF (DUF218 family)